MEKQRSTSISKSCRRLLVFWLFASIFTAELFSQTNSSQSQLTAAEISKLLIVPSENQELFTKVDLKFEVLIPKVNASQIQVLSTPLPSDISFKTVRKLQDFENNGTKIEIWYSFDKPGNYKLPALPVMIQNRRRNLQFQAVSVTDDPSKQVSRMVVIFENGTKVTSSDEARTKALFSAKIGKKVKFTVFIQYSTQLVQFNWDIPKDSIFTQTETFEITEVKYREKKYTHDLIPVAKFEWTGLKAGPQTMPKIKITATGYNGYRNELLLPEVLINFTEADLSTSDPYSAMFNSAFAEIKTDSSGKNTLIITEEDCIKLAKLYVQEENAILSFKKAREERINFETQLGIPSTASGDNSILRLFGSLILLITFIIHLIVAVKRHHVIRTLIFGSVLLATLVSILFWIGLRTHSYGISKGASISSVPEASAEAVSEISPGNRVEIKEKAGKWYYIELGEIGGWCLKDTVILIK